MDIRGGRREEVEMASCDWLEARNIGFRFACLHDASALWSDEQLALLSSIHFLFTATGMLVCLSITVAPPM